MDADRPVTEAELHAFVDGELPAERLREIEDYLAHRPEEAARVARYRAQKRELRALFDPVLDEALPPRLLRAARARPRWSAAGLAAGVALALLGGAAGWGLRGSLSGNRAPLTPADSALASAFAQRAAVAHAVYSPDARRPVEVDAEHQEQLVAWLSKRMGTPMKPPQLQAAGYALEGGRLLPGGRGPVAQFMYRSLDGDGAGRRLTLYVSNELGGTAAPAGASNTDTAFRYAQQGRVNVFYWVDGPFGYAISAEADRSELARVSNEVYRQLAAPR